MWARYKVLVLSFHIPPKHYGWISNLISGARTLRRLEIKSAQNEYSFMAFLSSMHLPHLLEEFELGYTWGKELLFLKSLLTLGGFLQVLSLRTCRIKHGGTWPFILADVVNKFICLRSLSLHELEEWEPSLREWHVWMYPKLLECPKIPESEEHSCYGLPVSDRRLVLRCNMPIS